MVVDNEAGNFQTLSVIKNEKNSKFVAQYAQFNLKIKLIKVKDSGN